MHGGQEPPFGGSQGSMQERLVAKWSTWVEGAFVEVHDDRYEARQKCILATLSIAILVFAVPAIAVLHAVPPLTHNHSLPESLVFDAVYATSVIFAAWQLFYLYFCGITLAFKVVTVLFWFMCIMSLDIAFNKVPWHFNISFLLILCVLLESEKDKLLMIILSVLVCVVTIVYVAMRALAHGGVIPHIYSSEREPSCEIQADPIVIVSEFTASVFPILCNFAFVRMYSQIARREERELSNSVEAATLIASKLVNFDLASAEELLARADSTSPIHEPLNGLLRNLRSYRSFLPYSLFSQAEHSDPPSRAIAKEMQGTPTAWEHATTAVQRLRDPAYSLQDFDDDMSAAFPELRLYDLEADLCSSGHTGFEEHQRTMGAMYAVYCLARLDIDGRELLSFGVDEDWRPMAAPHGDAAERMQQFFDSMDWDGLTRLLLDANLLIEDYVPSGGARHSIRPPCQRASAHSLAPRSPQGMAIQKVTSLRSTAVQKNPSLRSVRRLRLNEDRMMAMLVLTAIHDIMKNTCLLPTVQERHAPYNGIAAGTEIMDHDLALAYVLEHFPSLLPSYHGLEPGQRAPILFTQGKMGFNNGWLVQGEAPPGALFSKFKQVIAEGCASEADISFYFTHWLTDIAGAEPFGTRPWPGAEKFVSKFPLGVLNAFLESFSFVEQLATKSEVEVMEAYLESRWDALRVSNLPVGEGDHLAAMRLALMAQGFEAEAVGALLAISPPERELIAEEMARTGCRQQFRRAPAALCSRPAGPALLIYYAPALVQKAGAAQAEQALTVLAAVYRAARELFPLDPAAAEKTAVVRVDALKVLTPEEIMSAGPWHLQQMSSADAVVVSGHTQSQALSKDGAPVGFARIRLDRQAHGRDQQPASPVLSVGLVTTPGGRRVHRV